MYQHIMVPLDGSELAEHVLPHLEAIAKGCNAGKITLIRVVEPFHLYGGVESRVSPEERQRLEADAVNIARNYLDQQVKQLTDKGITAQAEVRQGKIIEELLDYADTQNVDLTVIATHGRSGISRWVWGSVADRLLRASRVPVLVVRPPGCVAGI